MSRDRFPYGGGRGDFGMDREFDHMRGPRGGMLPPHDDYDMDYPGPYSAGLLGEGPGPDMRPHGMGPGPGLLSEPGLLGGMGNDSLTAGLQEQILNHKRLEEKLNLRESQLALASNLLQQQSQMIGDINTKIGSGPGLMGPAPPNIPSLLDGPGPRHPPKRLGDGMRGGMMETKRSRFDDRPMGPNDRRHEQRARSDERGGMRRREDVYDPEFPTGERGFARHLNSRRHEDRLRGVGEATKTNMARNQAQQHIRSLEGDSGDWCRICDEPLKIPFENHKRTSIHKKRVVQVNMGCGWCDVRGFTNFREVLKHRATKRHIENESKKKPASDKNKSSREGSGSRSHRDGSRKDDDKKDKDKKHSKSKSNGTSHSSSEKKKEKEKAKEKALEEALASSLKELAELESLVFDETKSVGQNLVIPVTGFFCKLCHKFYNNEEAAKVGHCKTQIHFDKYKTTMTVKFTKKSQADAKAKEEFDKAKAEREAKKAEEAAKKAAEKAENAENEKIKAENDGEAEVVEIKDENEKDELMESEDTVVVQAEVTENPESSSAEPVNVNEEEESDANHGSEFQTVTLENEENNDEALDPEENMEADNDDVEEIEDNENEAEQVEMIEGEADVEKDEDAECEEAKADTEEETTTLEGTTSAKSPRGRARGGKSRGGKAKRGRK